MMEIFFPWGHAQSNTATCTQLPTVGIFHVETESEVVSCAESIYHEERIWLKIGVVLGAPFYSLDRLLPC